MSTGKQTGIIEEDRESRSQRLKAYKAGKKLYESGKINEAIDRLDEAYDPDYSPDKLNADIAYHLALCFIKFYDYDYADFWLKASVEDGSREAAFKLASFYESGINNYDRCLSPLSEIPQDYTKALKFYKIAAERRCSEAMYKCSEFYRYGWGVIKNYKKSFLWLMMAACYKQEYCFNLSEYYLTGFGVKKNELEAYIWAVMAQNHYPPDQLWDIEGMLDTEYINEAQEEAQKRVDISGNFRFSPEKLFEYMTREVLPKKLKPKENPEPKTPPNPAPAPPPPIEEEDLEPSPDIEYKYLRNCKKGFNPEKVTIELVIDTEIKGNQEIDFDSIIVSYKDAGRDKKLFQVLPKYIHKRHRRFLLQLAIQHSKAREEIKPALKKAIQDCDDKPMVSKINKLFLELFPGCHKRSQSTMINHQEGRLFPKLKVDVFKIIDSHDYKNWYNC